MNTAALGSPLVAIVLAASSTNISVGTPRGTVLPRDHWVLVQSEFDYLPVTERRITLQVEQMRPKEFIDALAKESGLIIELQDELPSVPLLSVSFRGVERKEAFQWLAEHLRVTFLAKPPNTLLIFVNGKRGSTNPNKDS